MHSDDRFDLNAELANLRRLERAKGSAKTVETPGDPDAAVPDFAELPDREFKAFMRDKYGVHT
jgi:hypothetical protein